MTDDQWSVLLDVVAGRSTGTLPAGFIIDSPWLPGWAGVSTLDYFTNDEIWFEANKKAVQTFPEALFLPGFWSEYGMCTEPSAFGARCSFHRDELPFAGEIIKDIIAVDQMKTPCARTDGLGPFMLNRLLLNRKKIEQLGHRIRFAVARGPMNIASFLMGTTEFLLFLCTEPERVHTLLEMITDYTEEWLRLQKEAIDSIEGIFILDDLVGFCGPHHVQEFAQPYISRLFDCLDVPVHFFHNDAEGRHCAPFLKEMGVNLFNFSFTHSIEEMQKWTNNEVALVGNIPPRDVLAAGTPEQVAHCVREAVAPVSDRSRLLLSCGGGMPDGVGSDNIYAFLKAAGDML